MRWMQWFPISCYLAIGFWQVATHYRELWTSDSAKRASLHLCFVANHQFDPLDPAARDLCFKNYSRQPQRSDGTMGPPPQRAGG